MTTPTKFSASDLLVLQRQLADWRDSQSGRPRLPAEVWDAAVALARRHRPSAVARTLGLSYPKLRQWMRRPRFEAPTAPASFVELKWVPPAGPSADPVGCAELRDPSGRVLRLHVGNDPQLMLALADSFWRQDR